MQIIAKKGGERTTTHPVNEDAGTLSTGNGRHEGERSRGEHRDVVFQGLPARADDGLGLSVDRHCLVVEQELDVVLLVPRRAAVLVEVGRHGQRRRIERLEVRRELDPIVRRPRLLAEGRYGARLVLVEVDQVLHEALPDHAVADDDHALLGIRVSVDGGMQRRATGEVGGGGLEGFHIVGDA